MRGTFVKTRYHPASPRRFTRGDSSAGLSPTRLLTGAFRPALTFFIARAGSSKAMFTPPAAAGLHSPGSLKALIAALLSSSSLLIYRLYYIEDFPRCQVLYARLAGQSMQLKRYSALTRRQAVPLHPSANCAPARRLCLPDMDRHRGLPCARGGWAAGCACGTSTRKTPPAPIAASARKTI